MVKNDLNMYTILETIMKIKATLHILVEEKDTDFLKKIQTSYFKNATINLDSKNDTQTEYMNFLNRDEREII